MNASVFGILGVLSACCLSTSAIAQNRNKVTINVKNTANHSITLLNVNSSPQEKNWTWSPKNVQPNSTGTFSAYWDDNQGPKTNVEFEGMTPGPYGCLVKCSVEIQVPLYEAVVGEGLKCPTKGPALPTFTTTSNNNVCGNVTCHINRELYSTWDSSNCNYTLNMDFDDPDHF
jgi:hypothetical protein